MISLARRRIHKYVKEHLGVNIHHQGSMAVLVDVGGDSSVEAVCAMPNSVNLCPKQGNPPVETSHLLR